MYTKVFDNISLLSRTTSLDGVDKFNSTFTTFRATDSYQNTDWQTLTVQTATTPGNVMRRDRHFSLAIPRNVLSADVSDNRNIYDTTYVDSAGLFKDRIRDKYCRLDFKHTGNSTEDFSLSYVLNKYRISYR
jgi:hypothetical protein